MFLEKWVNNLGPLCSNGIVEKHNVITKYMMEKVPFGVKYSLDIALAWCLSAKTYFVN